MIDRTAGHLIRTTATALAICSTVALPGSMLVASGPRRKEPVRPVICVPRVDVAKLLARSVSAAAARNESALEACTSEIREILDGQFAELHEAAHPAAKAVATSKNCLRLIALFASDTVRGRSNAEKWVQRRIDGRLAPMVEDCQRQIQDAIDRLDRELAASTLTLAAEVAGCGTPAMSTWTPGCGMALEHIAPSGAIGQLGLDGVTLSPAVAIEVYDMIRTRFYSSLVSRTTRLAKRGFARPIAAAVAELACAIADGPLPIGDMIGVAGAAWTAHEVCSLRHDFRRDLAKAIREGLSQAREGIEKDVLACLQDRVASHAAVQTRMHDEAARSVLK